VFAPERRGRPSAYQRPGQSSRVSPETLRSPFSRRSPLRCRDNHRRSRSPAHSRRERRRPVSSDSDKSASLQAIPVASGLGVCQSGHRSSGDLRVSSVRGIVAGSFGAVGDVINFEAAVPRPATATELALRVIPLINSIKVQLGEVQLALDVLPVFQTAINELKAGFVDIKIKYHKSSDRLVKTNTALKSLDDWSIAYDFWRVKKVPVPLREKVPVVGSIIQAGVGCAETEVPFAGGVVKVVGPSDLVEMSNLDLENMFA